jgi:hypothetical protein
MGWLTAVFARLRKTDPPPPAPIDPLALRDEMSRDDPEFRRVRDVHHDAQQVITGRGISDGLSIRRERRFWEQHGGDRPT